jgi:uncharacterized membrane protein
LVKIEEVFENGVEALDKFMTRYENLMFFVLPFYKVYKTKKDLFGRRGLVWLN